MYAQDLETRGDTQLLSKGCSHLRVDLDDATATPPVHKLYVTCITEGPVRTGDNWNGKRVVDSISSMLLSTVDNITVMNFSTWMFRCSDYMYLIQDHKSKHVQ